MSLAMTFIPKGAGKASIVEVRATLAMFMNKATIGKLGTIFAVQCWQFIEGQIVDNSGQEVIGVGWATRYRYHRLIFQYFADTHTPGGVWSHGSNTTPGGTGAHRNNRTGFGAYVADNIDKVLPTHAAVDTPIFQGNGTFNDKDEFAVINLNRLFQRLFSLMSGTCGQGLMEVQRDKF